MPDTAALAFPKPSRDQRLGEKARTKRANGLSRSGLRARVLRRDRQQCTADVATFGPHSGAIHMDHQWGRGKGRPPESIENCRALCEGHDRMKTDGDPTRIAWLEDFRRHAAGHGYRAEVAKVDVQVQLEHAQHPEGSR